MADGDVHVVELSGSTASAQDSLGVPAATSSRTHAISPRGKFRAAARSVGMSITMLKEARRKTFNNATQEGKVPLRRKILYAAPSFSLLSLTMLITIHAIVFYEKIGTDLSAIAFFTVVARSFDVITDPLMGWVSDSTRLGFGRRRPYILFGCWGYAIAFFLFMSPPSTLSSSGTANWFGVFYITFYLFDTIANVPYTAWGPELTDLPRERESVFFYRGLFDKIGVLAGAAGPAIVGGAGLSERDKYRALAAFFGVYYLTSMLTLVFNLKERAKSQESRGVPLVPSVLRAFKNVAFRPLLVGWVLDYMALGMISSMLPFFVNYVVLDPGRFSGPNCSPPGGGPSNEPMGFGMKLSCDPDTVLGVSLGLLFIASGIGMPIWKKLSEKYGKRNIWLAYNLVNSLTNFGFIIIGEGDVMAAYILALLNGIPIGGQFLIEAILSDVIDYDEFLNGTRSEGSFTVFAQFIPKVISIPSSAIPLAVIAAAGFVPTKQATNGDLEPQPQLDRVKTVIRVIFIIIPCIATLVSFWVKLSFPIKTEEMVQEISAGILAHEGGRGARDPVTGAEGVEILQLSDQEQDVAWLLDNFAWDTLKQFASGAKTNLSRTMKVLLAIGMIVLVALTGTTVATIDFLSSEDKTWSWVPSLACITAGMALCFTTLTFLRLQAAKSLEAMDDPPTVLAKKIIEHKQRGQRGGDTKLDKFTGGGIHELVHNCCRTVRKDDEDEDAAGSSVRMVSTQSHKEKKQQKQAEQQEQKQQEKEHDEEV